MNDDSKSRGHRSTWAVPLVAAALLVTMAVGSAILLATGILEGPVLPESVAPRLAYELDDHIYLADSDGGNAVRVAGGSDAVLGDAHCQGFGGEGSIWAPDGRHLAFRSGGSDECPRQVHVLDAEGRAVATVPGDGWDVTWARDSTRFATWLEVFGTIGIYRVDGERQAFLTVPQRCWQGGDQDPVWSPDGMSVIVWSCDVPVDGSDAARLFDERAVLNTTSCMGAAASPDGTRIASIHRRDGATVDSSLVITESDGTELLVVGEEPGMSLACGLAWSPAGDRVAFTQSSLEQVDGGPAESNIRLVDIPTGQVRTLADAPGMLINGFSPDGERLLYASWDSSTRGLWSIDAGGSNRRLLVPGATWGEWQPRPARPW